MANNLGPNQMLHSVASDLDLHCLLRPVCPNTLSFRLTFSTLLANSADDNLITFFLFFFFQKIGFDNRRQFA